MVQELHDVCTLLDKLTIDSLTLMEKHIQSKLDVESTMCEGESALVKARYIMGRSSVSKLQLPCDQSEEFEATTVVRADQQDDAIRRDKYDLDMGKKAESGADPIRWFGVLVPQTLHCAQEKFRRAIDYCVKCANLQAQLNDTLNSIDRLKIRKELLIKN